ncbi:MAG: hypothetical protein PHV43_00655 [Candidatus Colwellbacteria bacterium]|nr:hypothetical protein [Candidatus Colwellbacteria bacterium]
MEKTKSDYRVWAVVAYFLFFVPLLVAEAKKNDFVKFHVRQGLGLLITFFVARVLTLVVLVPLFAAIGLLSLILVPIINILLLVVLVAGIVNAASGEKKPLPVIGEWSEKYLKI